MKKRRKTKAVTRKVPATTNNITTGIVNFLLFNGHSASRVNVQGHYREELQAWIYSGSRRGISDIVATLAPNGRSLYVEIKKGDDTMSQDQKDFRDEVIAAGAIYLEIKTYSQFIDWYNAQGLPNKGQG